MRPLVGALLALASGCLGRADVVICASDEDCAASERCVAPVAPTRGVCAPRPADPSDAGEAPPERLAHVEGEGYAERSNDALEQGEHVASRREIAIVGVLGLFDGIRGDVDAYRLQLQADTFVEIVATASAAVVPRLRFGAPPRGPVRSVTGVRGRASRVFYVPTAGTWALSIEDARPGAGGLDHRYRIEVRETTPLFRALPASGLRERWSADADGAFSVLRVDLERAAVLRADVSGEDALLELRRVAPRALEGAVGGPTTDAAGGLHLSEVIEAGSYHLVVESSSIGPGARAPTLAVAIESGHEEREPNDAAATASAFLAPLVGTIGRGLGRVDLDVLRLRAEGGRLLSFAVEVAPGERAPELRFDYAGERLATQPNVRASARATLEEVLVPFDDLYAIALARDGAELGYTFHVETATRAPIVLGALSSTTARLGRAGDAIDRPGARRWYRFVVDGLDAPVVVLDARGAFTPSFALAGRDGVASYGVAEGPTARRRLAAGEYWLSITDRDGDGPFAYGLSLHALPVRRGGLDELAPGEAVERERAPGALRVRVPARGCYDLETAQADTASARSPLDTTLGLESELGATLATADDHGASRFARLEGVALDAGSYLARVGVKSGDGAYVLAVEAAPCPP